MVIQLSLQKKMKVVAAYLLAVLGGNTSPTARDIRTILASGLFSLSFSVFSCSVGFVALLPRVDKLV